MTIEPPRYDFNPLSAYHTITCRDYFLIFEPDLLDKEQFFINKVRSFNSFTEQDALRELKESILNGEIFT